MSSYYDTVIGSLRQAEIARAEDINLIQSNIQVAFEEMMNDMFGTGCILGGEEDDLKLTPIPTHVDQYNNMFDEDDSWLSFYDIYLRQRLMIEKSEIKSIKIEIKNTTNLQPTVFAEIRDVHFNLLKETNVTLPITEGDESNIIEFNFNLKHIVPGEYYFILRPVDISTNDLTANGDETVYDVITEDNFLIRYDANGSYNNGLDASYNGTDYLESRLLSAEITEDNMVEVSDANFDLCFEHIFSSGNTYVINPAPCIVAGQKVYPFDTHVSIDGPSSQGNRIDAVILTSDGSLEVTKGLPFYGQAKDSDYPVGVSGLIIAYITTYATGQSKWVCSNCGEENIGNISTCVNCGEPANNTKIPLIEQNDDNGRTRKRDILERLRRLEKKMDYQIDYNSPSRIKYTCEVDPILSNSVVKDQNGNYVYKEDTYGMNTIVVDGENRVVTDSDRATEHKWAFINEIRTVDQTVTRKINGVMTAWDVYMPNTKPKSSDIDSDLMYYHVVLTAKNASDGSTSTKTSSKTTTGQSGKSTTTTTKTVTNWYGLGNLKVKVEIQQKQKGKWKKIATIDNLVTNTHGAISLNLWSHVKKLKEDTYRIIATFGTTSVTTNLHVYGGQNTNFTSSNSVADEVDSDLFEYLIHTGTLVGTKKEKAANRKKLIKSKKKNITLSTTEVIQVNSNVANDPNTIKGKDNIVEDGIFIDTDIGEATLQQIRSGTNNTLETINKAARDGTTKKAHDYKMKKNTQERQSTYCLFSYNIPNDCVLKKITPYITRFQNIEKWTIILFKNDKVFNINTDRKTYIKDLTNAGAATTEFKNLYKSDWVKVGKGDKNGVTKVKTQHTFVINNGNGVKLKAGTYSILIYGRLKSGAKEGSIRINEYATSKPLKYGAISRVKGTSNMSKVYMEGNQRVNQCILVKFEKEDIKYKTAGSLIGPTINTGAGVIRSVTIDSNNRIPDGCSIRVFASNNGGSTYVEAVNGKVTFNGSGNELKWRINFEGTEYATPVIYYDYNKLYAFRIKTSIHNRYIDYEDYGRCYSTPVMNANSITRTLLANENITNRFEEWEFARLWMEDPEKTSEIDICFAYEDNEYDLNVGSKIQDIVGRIFYSQVFSGLTLNDFSQESIDYSNYDASIEYDENNYRFKLQSEYVEHYTGGVTIANPKQANDYQSTCSYFYGNINDYNIDYSGFDYKYLEMPYIYMDNTGVPTTKYSGMHIISSPCYKTIYDYNKQIGASGLEEDTDNEEQTTTVETDETKDWNYTNPYFDPNTNIIGVRFDNGLSITDNYTSITLDLKPIYASYAENGETTTRTDINVSDAMIPAGTLEVVFALNKYGQIEEDNATYGKAYTITQDLELKTYNETPNTGGDEEPIIGEPYTQITFNLSDLIGSEIYSIGIRVKKDAEQGIKNGYGLALGNISFGGYNRFPYTPYLYTDQKTTVQGRTLPKRLGWYSMRNESNGFSPCHAFAYNKWTGKLYHFGSD